MRQATGHQRQHEVPSGARHRTAPHFPGAVDRRRADSAPAAAHPPHARGRHPVSTRSVIARPDAEGSFCGTSCHYDGYPAHQGRVLLDAVTGHFAGDPDAACRYLIDEHPGGWSVLGGDFTVPAGYRTGLTRTTCATSATATATATSHPGHHSLTIPPATPSLTTPTWWTLSSCGCSPTAPAGGGRWPRRPGPSSPTGTPSTSTPNSSAAGGSTTNHPSVGRPQVPP
jgi:hypothetical protein